MTTEPAPPCSVCGAPATRLCDYVIGRDSYDREAQLFTCDAPLCERCAVRGPTWFLDGTDKRGRRVGWTERDDYCPGHPPGPAPIPLVMTAEQADAVRARFRLRVHNPAAGTGPGQGLLPFGA